MFPSMKLAETGEGKEEKGRTGGGGVVQKNAEIMILSHTDN